MLVRHHPDYAAAKSGKPYSAKLAVDWEILNKLRAKHGHELERWWRSRFGFGYECLTHSEGYSLLKTPNADRIRDRIIAAVQG
jgi:hypothetical protein